MARIPLEDSFADVLNKAQRGWQVSDAVLAERAGVTPEDLAAVKGGKVLVAVIRRLARHLKLSPNALESLALKEWYPQAPVIPRGFALFNTDCGDMTVNSYLVWDPKTRAAAAFDTGASADGMIDFISAERLALHYLFLTHTHEDHVADLEKLASRTGAQVWSHEREPVSRPGARTFREGVYFHLGEIAIKTLLTSGHSPGLTTFLISGLAHPLAIVGDALFASSIGGSATAFPEQYENTSGKLLTLPRDTVLAPGHGPLTTVAQEKIHNPFFASRSEKAPLESVVRKS